MSSQPRRSRADLLASFGASPGVVEELLPRGEAFPRRPDVPALPLPPEAHVQTWRAYAAEAGYQSTPPPRPLPETERVGQTSGLPLTASCRGTGLGGGVASQALSGAEFALRGLPQLRFPVRAGMSQDALYRRATRQGGFYQTHLGGLGLREPRRLRLWVCEAPAGPLPVLCTEVRDDFVLLVQALAHRNEPAAVPDAMGACFVSGFNNVDRLRDHRERWEAGEFGSEGAATWEEEFRRVAGRKELYQDRFVILWDGPYSNVPAGVLGLDAPDWLRLSRVIRLAHECTHYLTLRLFGVVRDDPLDELLADYAGVAAACGRFRADWVHRFMGLENFPDYRPGGRLENYQGRTPLSPAAFGVLQALVYRAAQALERFDAGVPAGRDRAFLIPQLARLSLPELAAGLAEVPAC